jgi:hypothetical protein
MIGRLLPSHPDQVKGHCGEGFLSGTSRQPPGFSTPEHYAIGGYGPRAAAHAGRVTPISHPHLPLARPMDYEQFLSTVVQCTGLGSQDAERASRATLQAPGDPLTKGSAQPQP